MTERDEEQPNIKVNDKRKFNLDGSIREGVEFETPQPIKAVSPAIETVDQVLSEIPQNAPDEPAAFETGEFGDEESLDFGGEEIPGAEDPASFVNFLSTLATNAAASLGAMPHPVTGQRSLDLETGKYWLDVLAMLKEKTQNNLHPQEARLLEGLLGDLRMQYVQIVRATEDKLKEQAAQKFSAGDILGKK